MPRKPSAAPKVVAPKRSRARGVARTVGVLLADMHTGASCSLWPGVVEAAEREGVNLIFFPGGRLRAGAGPDDLQRNAVYDLAGPGCLDGIVSWVSSIGGGLDQRAVEAFHGRYASLPLVCIAQSVRGAPTVTFDAYSGMRAVIEHLLERHGARRIAFIRGPAAHPSAEDRYRAYRDALSARGIPLDERLVTRPLRWDQGAEAALMLVDERGLVPGADFEAVAAASDLLALWALKTFQERGIRVPADLLVTGFNDTAESRLATPPLTTASAPFGAQGGRALAMLADAMAGKAPPREVTLPARLLVRRSCGCPSAAVTLAASGGRAPGRRPPDVRAAMDGEREACLGELTDLTGVGRDGRAAWLEPLLDSFVDGLGATVSLDRFHATLDNVLDRVILADADVEAWQDAVSALRRRALGRMPAADRGAMEDAFSQARVLVAEAAERQRTWRQWRADRLAQSVRELSASLLSAHDVERIADTLADGLPRLGIPSFALVLYEGEDREQARLVLAGTEKGRTALPSAGLVFPARLLVPRELLPRSRRYDLVVEPLHFQDQRIGYACFELGPRDGAVYEQLRGAISSALKGALLLRDAREARLAAEKADLIKTRLLANVSHELRAPLAVILQQAEAASSGLGPTTGQRAEEGAVAGLAESLALIRSSAEHQLRVINDLLDMSRADINELDLDRRIIDPRALLEEVFSAVAAEGAARPGVAVERKLPDRLPLVLADPVRLRQILFNLLGNALRFTQRGHVRLSAEAAPPSLLVRVEDTGPGVAPGMLERIFEPFVTAERGEESGSGIGLGLAIARHLARLHGGELSVESVPGQGATFILRLPLPGLAEPPAEAGEPRQPLLLLVARSGEPSHEIAEICRRRGLSIVALGADSTLEELPDAAAAAVIAWDLAESDPADWPLLRRLRRHPRLSRLPVLLYAGGRPGEGAELGVTGLVAKGTAGRALMELVEAACPSGERGPVLIVDDDPAARESHAALVRSGIPGCRVRTACDGRAALSSMQEETPGLVLLDLGMPVMDGAEVLERMREDPRLRRVPVIVLTGRVLAEAEVERIEKHARVTLQAKGVWSDEEAVAAFHRSLFGSESFPPQTGALVKRAVAWLARNHAREITRWQLAEAVHASPDYVGRLFHRELGMSPLDYLNRYRVHRARELLESTGGSVKEIAASVGFRDQAYFSRVFRRITGVAPQAIRREQ